MGTLDSFLDSLRLELWPHLCSTREYRRSEPKPYRNKCHPSVPSIASGIPCGSSYGRFCIFDVQGALRSREIGARAILQILASVLMYRVHLEVVESAADTTIQILSNVFDVQGSRGRCKVGR